MKFNSPQSGAALLRVVQQRLGTGTLTSADKTYITSLDMVPPGKYLFEPGK